jgi:uncharacterized membrane protein YedE/YeeE
MTLDSRRVVGALSAGVLFALGLVVSGMTKPEKVVAFLDPFGRWDPSLAFVMIGAIGVHSVAYRFARRRQAALSVTLPPSRQIDGRLVLGAGLFGIGWGIAGYCPGPSVVAVGAGNPGAWVFVLAILVGVMLVRLIERAPSKTADLRATS